MWVLDSTAGQGCDWSVEEGGRGFVYPERLNGGEDFLLVASEGHAHSEQVSMETKRSTVLVIPEHRLSGR